jgi:hypothetical protein
LNHDRCLKDVSIRLHDVAQSGECTVAVIESATPPGDTGSFPMRGMGAMNVVERNLLI